VRISNFSPEDGDTMLFRNKSTWRYSLEDQRPLLCRRENFKSHMNYVVVLVVEWKAKFC
jgi:hypothetical protein